MTSLDNTSTSQIKQPSADVPGAATHITANTAQDFAQDVPEALLKDLPEGYALSLPSAFMAMLSLVVTLIRVYGRAFRVPPERRSYASLQGECEIMAQLFELMMALPPKYVTHRTIRFLLRIDTFAKRRFTYLQTVMAAHSVRMDKIYKTYHAWRISVIHARAFMAGLRVALSSVNPLGVDAKNQDVLIPP